jgi:hypothetical protein
MGATPAIFDMSLAELKPNGKPMIDSRGRPPEKQGGRPITRDTAKQIRARARRKQSIAHEELKKLYKPIEEWDHEELARGRPRAKDGSFKGAPPSYIDRALHEQIVRQFEQVVRNEMNGHTVAALTLIGKVLADEEVDERGRPLVAASTKLDAAKFLIEHVIGKPKQRVESDISVKLQGLLGTVMVNPNHQTGGFELAQGYVEAESWEEDDDERSDD